MSNKIKIEMCTCMGLSRRKCPVFQQTKLRILIIIWIIIEIWTLNFIFLTRILAGDVKYIVFGLLFYSGERKKLMFLKEVDFLESMSTKIKFILIHNFPTIIITNQKQSLYVCSNNFIPRLKDFIDVNSVNMIMFSGITKCPDTNVRILTCIGF